MLPRATLNPRLIPVTWVDILNLCTGAHPVAACWTSLWDSACPGAVGLQCTSSDLALASVKLDLTQRHIFVGQ